MYRLNIRRSLLALPGLLALFSAAPPAEEPDGQVSQEELERITEKIRTEIEEMRGKRFERPVAVAVTDKKGFLDYAQERMKKMTTEEELAAEETTAKLLGLLPPDMDYLGEIMSMLEDQVGGFYDPAAEKFYLMSTFTGGLAKIILAHELTHALDDQLYDIDGSFERLRGNSDALFAYQAVVEGSGTSLMNRWAISHAGDLDPKELMDGGDLGMEAMAEVPPALWKPMLAAYLKGASFLARTDNVLMGQMGQVADEDIHRAFTDPPRSSEQILHPEKYWDPKKRDDPREVVATALELSEGWAELEQNTMGEMGLALCTEPLRNRKGLEGQMAMIGARYTNGPARGWDGDRIVLLGKGEARLATSLSVWDDEEEAQDFFEALERLSTHVEEQIEAYARERGVEGSGYQVRRGSAPATVRFSSWVGIGAEEARALADCVSFEVAAD